MIKYQKRAYLESGINYSPKRPLVFKVIVTWTAHGLEIVSWKFKLRTKTKRLCYKSDNKLYVTTLTIFLTILRKHLLRLPPNVTTILTPVFSETIAVLGAWTKSYAAIRCAYLMRTVYQYSICSTQRSPHDQLRDHLISITWFRWSHDHIKSCKDEVTSVTINVLWVLQL